MIVEKVYDFLKLNEDVAIPESVIEQFEGSVVNGLKRQLFKAKGDGTLRLSISGKCPRQAYYSIKYPELAKPLEPRAKFIFLSGDIWEAILIAIVKASGVNLLEQQKEVYFEGVKGHIDSLADINGQRYLVEIKSMAENGFKALDYRGMTDDFGYLTQVNVYMHALGLKQAIFLCVNKNTGHLKELVVDYNAKIVENARKNIAVIKKSLETNNLPPRKYNFIENKKLGLVLPFQCNYCPFVDSCWNKEAVLEFIDGKPYYRKINGGKK